jgi:beta-N-acetylhexosaminidase
LFALAGAAALSLVVGVAVGADESGQPAEPPDPQRERSEEAQRAVARLGLRQQVGQLLISSFDGTVMPDYISRRLRAGETAGAILFGRNGGPGSQWRRLTRSLQRAAGGVALVMVDQEGGSIRTVSGAGPAAAQPFQGSPAAVRRAARGAGRRLRSLGVNVNLAPVADVAIPGSVMGARAFAGNANAVAARTRASVRGLREGGVAATAKHFPGLGASAVNTDDGPATVTSSRATMRGRELAPFRAAVVEGVPLVMLSHALYPALDRRRIASQSPVIATGLLRGELGFDGVIVTDSLEAGAVLERSGVATAAERSLHAGADLILLTGSASWNEVFPHLVRRARQAPRLRRRVRESAARVLALKRLLR